MIRSKMFWLVSLMTVAGIGLRFWRLGDPSSYAFDEVYYAKWAHDYLIGNSFFDVHPPLGKLLIAVGIHLFGDTGFGWRVMPALAGSALVPLTYFVGKKLFTPAIGLLASFFVLLDGLMLVQSRTALLDIFQITFVLAAIAAFLAFRDSTNRRLAILYLMLTGILVGLAISTKWTAAAVLAPITFGAIVWWPRRPKLHSAFWVISLIFIPIGLYILSFIFNERTESFWPYLIEWHNQTWSFHQNLTATHPYMSRWWSWLYLGRPVWYYFTEENGVIHGILALGNPVLWWAALPALASALWMSRKRLIEPIAFTSLVILAFYLPWTLIGRTQFQYYISPAVPFLMIILAWWLSHQTALIRRSLPIVALIIAAFYYPILTALPVSRSFYELHLWFRSWI